MKRRTYLKPVKRKKQIKILAWQKEMDPFRLFYLYGEEKL